MTERVQRAFFDVINGEIPDRHGWLTYVNFDDKPGERERGQVSAPANAR